MGMGIPEEDARHFDEGFRAGGTLVTVAAEGRQDAARECLSQSGADLGSVGQGMASGAMSMGATSARRSSEDSQTVKLRQEELRTEEDRVQAGEEIRIPLMESGNNEAWRGNERRYRHDSSYSGPERRMAQV